MINGTRQANPIRTFHWLATSYVILLCASAISSSGLVKFASNAFALFMFAVLLVNWTFMRTQARAPWAIAVGLILFYIGFLGSLVSNYELLDLVDSLKIGLAPIFLIFGYSFAATAHRWPITNQNAKLLFVVMSLLPIFTLVLQKFALKDDQNLIFVNLNNAGLYAVTLLAFYNTLSKNPVSFAIVYLGIGIMFGTLGLFLAVVVAVVLCHRKWRLVFMAALLASICLFLVLSFPDISKALRVQVVVDSIVLLATDRIDLHTVTYAELVQLLQTQDLSFLFRLMHWVNLVDLYKEGTPLQWLFGQGTGASVRLTKTHLVPHNDYLRMLFEFGAVTFLGFGIILFSIARNMPKGWLAAPFITVVLYVFTENIITNYVAMALFFFSAGIVVSKPNTNSASNVDEY